MFDRVRSQVRKKFETFLKKFFDMSASSGRLFARWHGRDSNAEFSWAISSGGEHYLDTVGVTSSNLVSPTMKCRKHLRRSQVLFYLPCPFGGAPGGEPPSPPGRGRFARSACGQGKPCRARRICWTGVSRELAHPVRTDQRRPCARKDEFCGDFSALSM